jgi:glycosyltransferase involved in cell wall biosynthesis
MPPALQTSSGRVPVIAVVMPCYRVADEVLGVIRKIGPEVTWIFVVDDACPEGSGRRVQAECADHRVQVLFHDRNQGVGGATLTGYRRALDAGAEIVVKVDGDGQIDPALIPALVAPIARGEADYVKGNRFYDLEGLMEMPKLRLVGNLILSFASKMSSGYWNVFDPTNGFTALHAAAARALPFGKISRRYFFESDMLFRLYLARAVVTDIPMRARYGNEKSSLRIADVIAEFLVKHCINTAKRIFYMYFLRDFTIASVELVLGVVLFLFGVVFGALKWSESFATGVPATAGTVVLAALPILVGVQLLLAFLSFDIRNVPQRPLHRSG